MINFHLMDCMEIMKDKPDKYWGLAVVDTPYGIGEDGSKNHTRGKLAVSKNYKAYSGNDLTPPRTGILARIIQSKQKPNYLGG